MNETLLALSLAYVFFSILLLLAVFYSRLKWLIKAGLILAAFGFYVLSYQGWRESQGWPSHSPLPETFLLHFAVIEEPNKQEALRGGIFLWISAVQNRQLAPQPRVHQLPYSQILHGRVEAALEALRDGKVQMGRSTGEISVHNGDVTGSGASLAEQSIVFYDLPDPALPGK